MTTGTTATSPGTEEAPSGERAAGGRWRLVCASLLMLFVELALIRWTSANNVHLAYITNFVLLASFLGIGLGFMVAHSRRDIFAWTPVALAALVAFGLGFPVRLVALSGPNEFQGAFGLGALPQWVSLPIIFGLVVWTMAGLGQAMARVFVRFGPLEAYRLDIAGSIAGIVAFSVLSFLDLPPIAWGLIAAAGLVLLLGLRQRWWQWAAVAGLLVLLAAESALPNQTWSPYYKVTTSTTDTPGSLAVSANNIPHQTVYPVATLRRIEPFYFFAYRHTPATSLDNVLIIGAGTGNDVAVALSEGAKHVDAVEIDPVLAGLGKKDNPNHAYQNPRVTLHIDDGRAFLQNTKSRYNLILFALPDSLTALAGQSALRLESYLLTVQAIQTAKAHLAPGGEFSMYNYYEPFLLDRYATTLVDVFGSPPCSELGSPLAGRQQAVLTSELTGTTPNCATPWSGAPVKPATDDYPFPYLASPGIPAFYLWVIGLILAASLLLVRIVGGPMRPRARYLDLACMGAAFMLLESKNIVQFALLFGTTWFVNSLVFAGVLVAVFAAIEVARHVALPGPAILYAALLVALAIAWLVPQGSLLDLSPVVRFVAATVLEFAPIFLANLVFAQRFRDVGSSSAAFSANLLGAIVGGVLEYLSLLTGFRFLLIVVAGLYVLAFVFGRRHLVRRAA